MGSEPMSFEYDQKVLEAYFDGECTAEEEVLVKQWLEDSPECRASFERLGEIRSALNAPVQEAVKQADFGAMWSNIEREIAEPEPARQAVQEPEKKTGFWSRVFEAFGGQPLVPVAGLALIAAWVVMDPGTLPDTSSPDASSVAEVTGSEKADKAAGQPRNSTGVHIAYVSGVEYDSGTVILDQNLDDPSEPLIVWHIEGDDNGTSKGG